MAHEKQGNTFRLPRELTKDRLEQSRLSEKKDRYILHFKLSIQ